MSNSFSIQNGTPAGDGGHIGVIMPAYNAEKYLLSAAESILSQTYRDFTLLIVNDGSSDGTLRIAEELVRRDSRVSVLTLPNGGPAQARNAGLDFFLCQDSAGPGLRTADHIMFCDADDAYLPDAFETALKASADSAIPDGLHADIVFLGFTIVNPDGTTNDYCEHDADYTPDTLGQRFTALYKSNLLNQVWGKLFSAELIRKNGFRFPDYRWGEDRLFIYDCLEASAKIAVRSSCCYLYKMYNSASLISGYYDRKPEVCKISDRRVKDLCRRFGVIDDQDCRYMFLKSVFSCISNLYSPSCVLSREEKRAYTEKILRDDTIIERVKGTGGGTVARVLSAVMQTRSVALNMAAARLITGLGGAAPLLLEKLKHKK